MWKNKFSHIDITFAHPTALLSLSASSTVVTFLLSNLCSSLSIMLSNLLHLEQSPIHLFLKVHLHKTPLHQFPYSIESSKFWDAVQNICQFQAEIFVSLTSSIQRCYSSNCSQWWLFFPRKHTKFNATALSANNIHYACKSTQWP